MVTQKMASFPAKISILHLMLGWFLASVFIALSLSPSEVEGCNEAVCASVVSKCMLTQSCKCDLKNCSCCKECFNCLSYLFSECCSCVDMCPKPNNTSGGASVSSLSHKSHVEDYPDATPELFQVLMSEPDPQQRWISFTYPIELHQSPYFRPKITEKEIKLRTHTAEQDVTSPDSGDITFNCTVAYMSQCMSWSKCKTSCHSTGASSYRWFHDGCCQCVGNTCINYGLNESRCLDCPIYKSTKDIGDEPDDDAANYAYENYEDSGTDDRKMDSDLE